MKKTIRKLFVLVLTVLMLMSVMGVQSFATFDFLKAPEITDVAFADDIPISIKDMREYFDTMEELLGELKDWGDYDYTIEDIDYDITYSNMAYEVDVTLADGNTVTVDLNDWNAEINKYYKVGVDAYVTYEDYIAAVESGADSIDVTVEVDAFNTLTFDSVTEDPLTFTLEKELVPCFVLSIVPIKGVPSEIYSYADYFDIDGATFLVTYGDLKTETLTVSVCSDELGDIYYEMGGNELYVWCDQDEESEEYNKLNFEYMDADYTKDISAVEEPFESIEITECDFDAKTAALSSISYDITWKDGKKESFTKTFSEAPMLEDYVIIEAVDSFYVYLYIEIIDYSAENNNADNYNISLEIGYEDVADTYSVENPYGGLLNIIFVISNWLSNIKDFIYNFFLGFML